MSGHPAFPLACPNLSGIRNKHAPDNVKAGKKRHSTHLAQPLHDPVHPPHSSLPDSRQQETSSTLARKDLLPEVPAATGQTDTIEESIHSPLCVRTQSHREVWRQNNHAQQEVSLPVKAAVLRADSHAGVRRQAPGQELVQNTRATGKTLTATSVKAIRRGQLEEEHRRKRPLKRCLPHTEIEWAGVLLLLRVQIRATCGEINGAVVAAVKERRRAKPRFLVLLIRSHLHAQKVA